MALGVYLVCAGRVKELCRDDTVVIRVASSCKWCRWRELVVV